MKFAAAGRLQLMSVAFDASEMTVQMLDGENKSLSLDRAEAQLLKSSTNLIVEIQRGTDNSGNTNSCKQNMKQLSMIEFQCNN